MTFPPPEPLKPAALLELFEEAAKAVNDALLRLPPSKWPARTTRPGQYEIDLVADAAALAVLHGAEVAVMSEESAWSGTAGAPVTVVVDPIDGSTNASRGLPYWSTSLCAVDGDGPLAALVVNQVTGVTTTAVRGEGAHRDGRPVTPSGAERVEDAIVALGGRPPRWLAWHQFRALGAVSLVMCDLAAGIVEGFVDADPHHAPWDYLGGLLICVEAGAVVVDAAGLELVELDVSVRRQLVGAGTPVLLGRLLDAARPG